MKAMVSDLVQVQESAPAAEWVAGPGLESVRVLARVEAAVPVVVALSVEPAAVLALAPVSEWVAALVPVLNSAAVLEWVPASGSVWELARTTVPATVPVEGLRRARPQVPQAAPAQRLAQGLE